MLPEIADQDAPQITLSNGKGPMAPGSRPFGRAGAVAAILLPTQLLLLTIAMIVSARSGGAGLVGTDFVAYFTGASLIAEGHAAGILDAAHQAAVQRPIIESAGLTWVSLINFINPPVLALIVMPILPLGLRAAALTWSAVNLIGSTAVILWVGGLSVARTARPHRRNVLIALSLLGFAPFLEGWFFGQMLAIMLFAFGGWLVLSRSGRSIPAGLALSLTLMKPQYAPFMVIYLAWKRQWKQLMGFALGGMVQAVVTAAMLIPGLSTDAPPRLEALLPYLSFGGTEPNVLVEYQLNLRGLIWNAFPELDQSWQLVLLVVITVIAIGVFLCVCGRRWNPRSTSFAWEALALFAIAPLAAYHNNPLQLYLLLVPLAALGTQYPAEGRLREILGIILLIPSLGTSLGVAGHPHLYYAAAWVTALLAIATGVRGMRLFPERKWPIEAHAAQELTENHSQEALAAAP